MKKVVEGGREAWRRGGVEEWRRSRTGGGWTGELFLEKGQRRGGCLEPWPEPVVVLRPAQRTGSGLAATQQVSGRARMARRRALWANEWAEGGGLWDGEERKRAGVLAAGRVWRLQWVPGPVNLAVAVAALSAAGPAAALVTRPPPVPLIGRRSCTAASSLTRPEQPTPRASVGVEASSSVGARQRLA